MQETTCTAWEWILITRGRACTIGTYFLPLNLSPGNQSGGEGGCGEENFKEGNRCRRSYFTNFYKKKSWTFEGLLNCLIWFWTKIRVGNQMLVHYAIAKMTKAMDKARGDKNSWHICHIKYICYLFKPFKSSTFWGWEGVLIGGHSSYKQSKMKFHMIIF